MKRFADLLVGVGLWHAPGHNCQRCPDVAPGTWLFHDWFALGYDPAAKERVTRLKRKELRDPQIIAEVWARDCLDPRDPTVAACRYCGTVVKRQDRRSDARPHLDHVDPSIAIGSRNIVVSCSACNQQKGNRTPAEAGLQLRPPPRSAAAVGDAAGPQSPRHDEGPRTGSTRSAQHSGRDTDRAHSAPTRTAEVGHDEGPRTACSTPGQTTDQETTRLGSTSDQPPDQALIRSNPTVPVRARAGTGAWEGSGRGEGRGPGKGDGTGTATPSPPSPGSGSGRRRKRRRSRRPQATVTSPPSMDAGAPPDGVSTAGRFGSPYHGWTGPPDTTGDENTCPTHGLPDPCRKCMNERGAQ